MFNERGYLKSNSFSLDGNEVINDFNGNLIYTQRLWYEPVTQNGVHFDLKLSYNGSVGHLSSNGFTKYGNLGNDKHHSLNLPEWIISVNNIAIQTFNFENERVTWATGGDTTNFIAQNDDVNTLINGYHSCVTHNDTQDSIYATLSILLGDGSVRQYYSDNRGSYDTTGTLSDRIFWTVYTGEYRTLSKDDKSRGFVDGRDSTFTIFNGDGSKTVFQFYIPEWKTKLVDPHCVAHAFIMLLPIKFEDKFGDVISIGYEDQFQNNTIYGRPFVWYAGSCLFDWGTLLTGWTGGTLKLQDFYDSDYPVRYEIKFSDGYSWQGVSRYDEKNRGFVREVKDYIGRKVAFEYDAYLRKGDGFRDEPQDYDFCVVDTVNITKRTARTARLVIPRLSKITYPDSGFTRLSYYDHGNSLNFNDSLNVDLTPPGLCNSYEYAPCIRTDVFDTLGRDPFYTNMVVSAKRYFSDSTLISNDSLIFFWDTTSNFNLDGGDEFYTERIYGDGNFQSDDTQYRKFYYAQYWEKGPFSSEERDRGWTTKQFKVETGYLIGETRILETTNKYYNLRMMTFEIDSVITEKDGITTKETYLYKYTGIRTDQKVNLLNWTATIDSWGQMTQKFYNTSYLDIYNDTNEVFNYFDVSLVDSSFHVVLDSLDDGADSSGHPSRYDTIPYYTTILNRSETDYYDSSSSTGFIGQVEKSRSFIIENNVLTDTSETTYEYLKNSEYFFCDGNLRKVENALGDSTIYQYYDQDYHVNKWLAFDSAIQTDLSHPSNLFAWGRKTSFISNDIYGWDTVINVREVTDSTIRVFASAAGGGSVVTKCDTILVAQDVPYRLMLPSAPSPCPTGAYSQITLNNSGTPLYKIECGDSVDSYRDTISVEPGDVLEIKVDGGSLKSNFYVKGYFTHRVSFDTLYDTVGVRDQNAITSNRRMDRFGNPESITSTNGFISEIYYDDIKRVKRGVLPGNFPPTDYFDTLEIYDIAITYSSSDGIVNKYDGDISYCDSSILEVLFEISNAPPDKAPPDEIEWRGAYLPFANPYNIQPEENVSFVEVDTAYLNIYCLSSVGAANSVRFHKISQTDLVCGSVPIGDLDFTYTLQVGWNRIPLTDGTNIASIAILPSEDHEGDQKVQFASSEYADSDYWPWLEVYCNKFSHSVTDSIFTMRYDYKDKCLDNENSSVSIAIRADYDRFAPTSKAVFDDLGRLNQTTVYDSLFTDSTYTLSEYDFANRVVTSTDQLGYETDAEYDALGRGTKSIFPDSANSDTRIEYTGVTLASLGLSSSVDSASAFLFDMPNQNLFKTTSFNEDNKYVKQYSDINGNVRISLRTDGTNLLYTYFDYDEFGRNTLVIKPEGDSVQYRYNNLGWLLKEWAADYDTIFYEYDKLGRMIASRDGNLSALCDDTLTYWSYIDYDAIGRVLETGEMVIDSNGVDDFDTTKSPINDFFYDQDAYENSNGLTSLVYSNGNGYEYGEEYNYDARGRLKNQTNHFEPTMDSTTYDSTYVSRYHEGGVDSALFVLQKDCELEYKLKIDPSVDLDSYITIKKRHNNETFIDSISIEEICPECIRITKIDTVNCIANDTIVLFINIDSTGSDPSFADFYAMARYQYYNRDQYFLKEGKEFDVSFEYNHADQLIKLTYPDGSIVTYEYDNRGRLQYVGDESDTAKYACLKYTDRNELEQLILRTNILDVDTNLQVIDYAYNARGWLNSINNGTSSSSAPDDLFGQQLFYYGHPDSTSWPDYYNGNIGGQMLDFQGSNTYAYSYSYDDIDRLTESRYETDSMGWLDETFSYDKNGNILTRKYSTSFYDTIAYNYTTGTNQLSSYIKGKGRVAHTSILLYDSCGNLAFDSGRGVEYKHDIYNQLDTAKFYPEYAERLDLAFGYNIDRLRIYKDYHYTYLDSCDGSGGGSSASSGGGIGSYGLDLDSVFGGAMMESGGDSLCRYYDNTRTLYIREKLGGKVLAEYDDKTDSLLFTYIYAGDKRIAMRDKTGNLHFYLSDHLGSTRLVIDSDGTVNDHYDRYFAFGDASSQTVSTEQKFRYTSKPYDDEGPFDLYYYGARYYNPLLGRFIAIDPLRSKYPGWNPYAYCRNNPIRRIDPDGKASAAPVVVPAGALPAPPPFTVKPNTLKKIGRAIKKQVVENVIQLAVVAAVVGVIVYEASSGNLLRNTGKRNRGKAKYVRKKPRQTHTKAKDKKPEQPGGDPKPVPPDQNPEPDILPKGPLNEDLSGTPADYTTYGGAASIPTVEAKTDDDKDKEVSENKNQE